MEFLPRLVFIIIIGLTIWIIAKRIRFISRNIQLGLPQDRTDHKDQRWRNLLLVAFGQQKMFKRPIPAILHLFIYIGFIIINIEVLEFIIDGLFGSHRFFASIIGGDGLYTAALNFFELLAILVLISCVVFLIRRNVLKVNRFEGEEMTRWPKLDANIILMVEIVLMIAIIVMNATDSILQARSPYYTAAGPFYFSGLLVPLFENMSTNTLIIIERFAWWFHIIGILAFAVYVTYSKHLHIFLAFPNTYYGDVKPKGEMRNMPVVTTEVKNMLGIPLDTPAPDHDAPEAPADIARFGAKDVTDLSWKNILDAYTCTQCGRCTDSCPANQTGKKLSPRKIVMDVRYRAEEIGRSLDVGGPGAEDGKALFRDYITEEEINACTTCQACVEACPVLINPLDVILQIRRYMSMEESSSPQEWQIMFQNIETSFAPWKFPPSDRFTWADSLKNKSE
ncbi:(Fe-S)-binding protein [Cesiribacter andamanensis]|uniref:Succinate dehydrogenase iron-sulfur subunit n=1 Tax=Cesiribacter andamanensis AMV16 TaxID=1279009 RepID=M7N349_9BACT|nr:(Fe-S)-binding protein [Cesiribacter andamanensis]EMR03113.1 succinate dehydrogenase iron-sulfur subunit [Cesiribacter andamanensis AMV16]